MNNDELKSIAASLERIAESIGRIETALFDNYRLGSDRTSDFFDALLVGLGRISDNL